MRKFADILASIRKSDDALQLDISEAAAYVVFMYHTQGRTKDGAGHSLRGQFISALPVWIADFAKRWALDSGKRELGMGEREAKARADAFVAVAFAGREEQRRIAKEQRAARAERKTAEAQAEGRAQAQAENQATANVVISSPWAILANGVANEMTEAEFNAVMATLAQMRAPRMLRAA